MITAVEKKLILRENKKKKEKKTDDIDNVFIILTLKSPCWQWRWYSVKESV